MGFSLLPSGEVVPRYQPVDADGNILVGGGGGGGGGSGDASQAKQNQQITLETAIRDLLAEDILDALTSISIDADTVNLNTDTLESLIAALRDRLPTVLANNRLVVDGSGVTQPISASALPLPSGAATDSALQAVRDRLPSALVSGRVSVDGSAVTQPVSGGFATQTTLEAVLDKIIAAPATAANQSATNTTLSSILSKLITAPATESTLDAIKTKLITAPATETKQDTQITRLTETRDRLNAGIQVGSLKLPFRDDFGGTDIDLTNWTLVQTGTGHTVSVASSELRIDTGTTANSETIIRSVVPHTAPFRTWFMVMLSQRIANQEFYLELSDTAGNNYGQWLLDGVTATSAKIATANGGSSTGQNTVTCASLASYQLLEIEANLEEYYFSYRNPDSASNRNHSRTATRQIPNPSTPLYLQIRAKNLGTAPAGTTRLSVDAVSLQDHQAIATEIVGGRGSPSAAQGIPVYTTGGFSTNRDTSVLYTDSTAPLAANATFTGSSRDGGSAPTYNRFRGWVYADQPGTLYLEQSRDNSTWRVAQTVPAAVGVTTFDTKAYSRYIRLRYVNGATAQGAFELVSSQWGIGASVDAYPGDSLPLTQTATIANGASLSGAVDMGGKTLLSLEMPSGWTAANISFDVSNDNSSYVACYLEGTEYTFPTGASRGHSLNPAAFAGWRYVKVRSGISGTTVAQGASRDIKLYMKAV